ncbi:hypothetical protein GCM10010232_10940 [Streptomyces amakusaensis]|uniref:Uncharacterized protein n=1 Tax=Streptomyces amakusaensis TaxID=67271 RepID=A0ABW0AAQ3_9ACTN
MGLRILTPVDELTARAVRRQDEDHVDWSATRWTLTGRRGFETWSSVVAHRHHPSPAHRRFVADYLWTRAVTGGDPRLAKVTRALLPPAKGPDVELRGAVAAAPAAPPGQRAQGVAAAAEGSGHRLKQRAIPPCPEVC